MAITAALGLGFLGGALLSESVHRPALIVRIYPPSPDCRPVLQLPVDYDASILQTGPGISTPQWRYYKAREL
jgi:hypothetical protein